MPGPQRITWILPELAQRPGVLVAGAPRLTGGPRPSTQALAFDGRTDGLTVPLNPVARAAGFLVEVLLRPAPGGADEERFLHVQESASANRLLLETRRGADTHWYLDTYLQSGAFQTALNDPARLHPTGEWAVAGLFCAAGAMVQLLNRQVELFTAADIAPLSDGVTTLGMRANRVSFFRGAIYAVRFTTGLNSIEQALAEPALS